MNLIAIYAIFRPTAAEYTFFSAVHGTFSKIDHILRHKMLTNTRKLKELLVFYWVVMKLN
jgi:hypothetical protein